MAERVFSEMHRTPQDELWAAVGGIDIVAHREQGIAEHYPTERVQVIEETGRGQGMVYDLDYTPHWEKYWPRLVVVGMGINHYELYEQRDDEKVHVNADSTLLYAGELALRRMAERVNYMRRLILLGGKNVEWKLINE